MGKYVELFDVYFLVVEVLCVGGFKYWVKVEICWVVFDGCEMISGVVVVFGDVYGVFILGGFGIRGFEGKIGVIVYVWVCGLLVLGLCFGL